MTLSITEVITIWKNWEQLRVWYNSLLLLVVIPGVWPIWSKIPDKGIFLIENAVSFVQANILYFAGPLVELTFKYFNKDLSRRRLVVWVLGTSFSVAVAIYSLALVYRRFA